MSAQVHHIKRGDLLPVISETLYDANGAVVNLTNATGVTFLMKNPATGTLKVNAAATVTSATGGVVTYNWTGTDTDTAGSYQAEWQVTWTGGKTQTFPTAGFTTIVVSPDLGP